MAQCKHGEMTFKEGMGAKGPWSAYFCPTPKNSPDQCKPQWVPKGQSKALPQFDQQLDRSAAQMDGKKKDATITKLAIAKSMIEAGFANPSLENLTWAAKWVEWAEDRMPFAPKPPAFSPPPQQHPPTDIPVDNIPF